MRSIHRQLERQRRGVRTTRLRRPQASALVRSTARVHRIPPRARDDRDTPLSKERDGGINKTVSSKPRSYKFFGKGLDSDVKPNHHAARRANQSAGTIALCTLAPDSHRRS